MGNFTNKTTSQLRPLQGVPGGGLNNCEVPLYAHALVSASVCVCLHVKTQTQFLTCVCVSLRACVCVRAFACVSTHGFN